MFIRDCFLFWPPGGMASSYKEGEVFDRDPNPYNINSARIDGNLLVFTLQKDNRSVTCAASFRDDIKEEMRRRVIELAIGKKVMELGEQIV